MSSKAAHRCGKQLSFATDDLGEALATWRKYWLKRVPTDEEKRAFLAGFSGEKYQPERCIYCSGPLRRGSYDEAHVGCYKRESR